MKKIFLTIFIIIILLTQSSLVMATQLEKALLYNDHYTKEYLYFENGNKVKTAVIMYNKDGKKYPAYCIERLKEGVGELPSYEVKFKEKINNDGLWRIVSNSYPYKTPPQMGLENTDEAYFATKQAIYRYMENEGIDYYAGGIGEEGIRVLNAIDNLLKIGYNGKEKYGDFNISINKLGDIKIDEKYFIQTCELKGNIDFNNLKIETLDNAKLNIIDNKKFDIMIPRNLEISNIKLKVNINGNTKPLLYGEAYNENYQDYIITGESYENISKDIDINIETPKLAKIEIIKKSAEYNKYTNLKAEDYLEKAIFHIIDNKGNVCDILTTDEKGYAISKDLDLGTYIVKEIKAPEFYLLDEQEYKVNLSKNNEVITYTLYNNSVDIKVNIEKTGTKETESGKEIEYLFPRLENKSNIELDKLIWIEELPNEINIQKMWTGVYNKDIKYSVSYRIEGNNEWILFNKNLSSTNNHELDFSVINSKITNIMFEFTNVDKDFFTTISPKIIANVCTNLKQGDYFINKTSLEGYYKGEKDIATAEHTTIVYEKEEPPIILPKTGK